MNVGDPVILCLPGNPIADGRRGVVRELTPYGCLVSTPGVGSGEFRCLPEEVELEWRGSAYQETPVDLKYAVPPKLTRADARRQGFSGEPCPVCQGVKTVRTGTCLTCQECASTSGCG